MTFIRNFIDQLFDGASKKKLRQTCKLIRSEFDTEPTSLGSKEDFYLSHDLLITELSKVGRATEEMEETDFNLSRYDGDRSDIGVVCNRHSAKIILAVRSAQQQFPQPYPVRLDCEDGEIVVLSDGRVFGSAFDEDSTILDRFGFVA